MENSYEGQIISLQALCDFVDAGPAVGSKRLREEEWGDNAPAPDELCGAKKEYKIQFSVNSHIPIIRGGRAISWSDPIEGVEPKLSLNDIIKVRTVIWYHTKVTREMILAYFEYV